MIGSAGHSVSVPHSEVSLRDLLCASPCQLDLGQELLQPSVLGVELLEPLRVVGRHPAVLGEPAMPDRLRDLQVAAHLAEAHSPKVARTILSLATR